MATNKVNIAFTVTVFTFASLLAFFILNRWLFTDIGILSYGRVWQFYLSYSDFGFVRRALIGSILSETRMNLILKNEYQFALTIHHIAIASLSSLIAYYCISRKITDKLFLSTVAFSPALIIHSGYNTGSLDIFVLILAAINILFIRQPIIFSILLVAGILTHELSLFTVPAQFAALLICGPTKGNILDQMRALSAPIAALLLAAIVVLLFGKSDVPQELVEEVMRQKIPNAAEKHGLWSGYFEIASTLSQNSGFIRSLLAAPASDLIWVTIPLIYVAVNVIRLCAYAEQSTEVAIVSLAVLSPLLTSVVAGDHYRWNAMSANMALVLALLYVNRLGRSGSRWDAPLLLFGLFAPFGGAEITRPFPMHQFAIERFFN